MRKLLAIALALVALPTFAQDGNPCADFMRGRWEGMFHQYSLGFDTVYKAVMNVEWVDGCEFGGHFIWPGPILGGKTTMEGYVSNGKVIRFYEPELVYGRFLVTGGTYKIDGFDCERMQGLYLLPDSLVEGGKFWIRKGKEPGEDDPLDEKIERYADEKMREWKRRAPDESAAQWEKRISATTPAKQRLVFKSQAINEFASRDFWCQEFTVIPAKADGSVTLIMDDFEPIKIPVPSEHIDDFVDRFNELSLDDLNVRPDGEGGYVIENITLRDTEKGVEFSATEWVDETPKSTPKPEPEPLLADDPKPVTPEPEPKPAPKPVYKEPKRVAGRPVTFVAEAPVRAETITINVWDNNRVDGDVISLNLNGRWILEDFGLKAEKKTIEIELEQEINYLVLHAINLGREGRNTASLEVKDGTSTKVFDLTSDRVKSEAIKLVRKD